MGGYGGSGNSGTPNHPKFIKFRPFSYRNTSVWGQPVLGFGIVSQLVFPVCEATWQGEATAKYSKALQ